MDDADTEATLVPKKPFLRRGEGTTRRVYASQYREEAKNKRLENAQRAQQRQEIRRRQIQTTDTAPTDDASPTKMLHSEPAPPMQRDVFGMEEGLGCPVFGEGEADGRCNVTQMEGEEVKRDRQSEWLENQRRHEEQQWTEAMELREFEEMERQIVEETQKKIKNAEGVISRKHVTFRETLPTEDDHHQTPLLLKCRKNGETPFGVEEGKIEIRHQMEMKGRAQNQKGMQKLKSMAVGRGSRSGRSIAQTTPPKNNNGKSMTHKTKTSPSLKALDRANCGDTSHVRRVFQNGSDAEVDTEFIVDSSFLDRLVEKDFHEEDALGHQSRHDEAGPSFAEKLRLQSMKEDLENDKREWQVKQVLQISRSDLLERCWFKANAKAQFEAMKVEELKKIKKERRVLEQQSKALLKLPNKKERSEIEGLEALLETERKEARSKEARHKLTVERLKDQIQHLQIGNKELQDEVKWHEELQLKQNDPQGKEHRSTMTSPLPALEAGTQTQINITQESSPLNEGMSYADARRDKWAMRLENPFYSETSTRDSVARQEQTVQNSAHQLGYVEDGNSGKPDQWPTRAHASSSSLPFSFLDLHQSPVIPPNFTNQGMSNVNWQMGGTADPCTSGFVTSEQNHLANNNSWMGQPVAFDRFQSPSQQPMACNGLMAIAPQQIRSPSLYGTSTNSTRTNGLHPFNNGMLEAPWQHLNGATNTSYWNGNHVWPPPTTPPEFATQIRSGGTVPGRTPSFQYDMHNVMSTPIPATHQEQLPMTGREPNPASSTAQDPTHLEHSISQQCLSVHERDHLHLGATDKNPSLSQSKTILPSRTHHPAKSTPSVEDSIPTGKRSDGLTGRHFPEEPPSVPRVATFDNGTIKQTYPDGRVVVWFGNADVKHVHPCGRVEYFYADLNTWQVTHSSDVDIFYFDIGQVEAHKDNGDKHIIFPDGTVRTVSADG